MGSLVKLSWTDVAYEYLRFWILSGRGRGEEGPGGVQCEQKVIAGVIGQPT